ncbi:MAG TPA: aldo/keto reductase [Clostridiales bacterium]|nr:aldo/keto reductase [Clostridiales bacterium]
MNYRTDPKNGEKLSILGFGCMRLPQKKNSIDMERSEAMIIEAIERGVNYFDTAYVYQKGKSEQVLGQTLAKGYRDRVNIATKMPPFMVRNRDDMDKILNKQLQRLQTDHIDYYLIHMLTDIGTWDRLRQAGLESWIADRKADGRIHRIGFSFHGIQAQFIKLIDAYNWDFCQIQYNYLDENNQAGKAGLLYAAGKGLPVIIMEPLRGGKIVNNLPPEVNKIWHSAKPVRSPAEWALRWVWSHPEVTVVLSGMSDEAQLGENLQISEKIDSAATALDQGDLELFDQARAILSEKTKVNCTACSYCLPCPAGVDIPGCFALYNEKFALESKGSKFNYLRNTGAMTAHPGYASLCIECGKCESHCPQNIAIRQQLKAVAREMEGPLFKPMIYLGKKVMKVKSER